MKFETVKRNSRGQSVVVLQSMLRALQYLGADGKAIVIDGFAGENTMHAVDTFQTIQRAYGYECGTNGKNDASFGPRCWERLLGV